MLNERDLISNFADVTRLEDGVFRCSDVLPKKTIYYYFRFGSVTKIVSDYILISETNFDDEFALLVMARATSAILGAGVSSIEAAFQKYEFDRVFLAGSNFHRYLVGRLDNKRANLVLCIPAYHCEFTEDDDVDTFVETRRSVVDTSNWNRDISPRIKLRFDNPQNGSGTNGEGVIVKYDVLLGVIRSMDGVPDAFVEIENYNGNFVEIVPIVNDEYFVVRNRVGASKVALKTHALFVLIWEFLTR